MVSTNTREAVEAFIELLHANEEVMRCRNKVNECAVLVPHVELKYYTDETNRLVKVYAGEQI